MSESCVWVALIDRNISGLVDLIPQEFKKAMDGNALVVTSTNPDKAIPPKSVTIFLSEWDEDENVAVDGANEKCNNHHCAMKLQLKTNLKVNVWLWGEEYTIRDIIFKLALLCNI